ncbi:flagellar motor protein [Citreicoccus inhibens]|uniref:flagellar motor protein n=1 Tax=Citreicoccus inhibens TaxID=2849499 RepID=UPI001F1D18B7|nr:flagellar motor protein [Citreicoccus inhibens]
MSGGLARLLRWALLMLVLGPAVAMAQRLGADVPSLASTLAGRVCRDLDGDGRCGPEEPGVADVRVVLDTGREVRTDAEGRYHLTDVDSRSPDATGGVHLRPGRHRMRVDPRSVPVSSVVTPRGATVELPWGAVALQDFAVSMRGEPAPPATLSYSRTPPEARVTNDGLRFLVAGRARPGDRVAVAGTEAQVDASGSWWVMVPLQQGQNVLPVTVTAREGGVRFYRQRVELVRRGPTGWLVIPRALEPSGALRLPAEGEAPVASGFTSVRVEGAPGTRVRSSQGEAVLGPDGSAELPVLLVPGANAVTLSWQRPGESAHEETVTLDATAQPFAVGLLDVELRVAPSTGDLQLRGRGAAHAEGRWGPLRLVGELELRDTDFRALHSAEASDWLRPRVPERFERALDPDLTPAEWGDDSVSLTPNPSEGRLRLEVRHDEYGRVGLGTYRASRSDREVGRYQRPLFGPYAELTTGEGPLRGGVNLFAGGLADPTLGVTAVPAHEELRATGGSLYYLGGVVAEGSEVLRVEVRDGVTGLPVAEHHLVRGRDYDIDAFAGRILLARPLSFLVGASQLRTDALVQSPEPVLVADYAALQAGASHDAVGGEVWGGWWLTRLGVSAVRERREGAPFQLVSGQATSRVGRYTLVAEVASSRGVAVAPLDFGVSDDGGLSFLRPGPVLDDSGGAVGLRVRGPGPLGDGGALDASFRQRSRGFSDGSHFDAARFRQLSLRVTQPLGPLRLTLLGDDRRSADPRLPFEDGDFGARTFGVGVGYGGEGWEVRAEARDGWLRATQTAGEGPLLSGGRTSAGVSGRMQVARGVSVSASHRQMLVERGEGPGRVDDTFSSAGVDVELTRDAALGVRGGWGPKLGPQAWLDARMQSGPDIFYGGYSVDVDGPNFGAGRVISGARRELDTSTSVFVESTGAHDANVVRLERAVGFRHQVVEGFEVGARYERGVRHPLDIPSDLTRDVGAVDARWLRERVSAGLRAEVRHEAGTPARGDTTPVDRTQLVLALTAEARLVRDVTASGRLNWGRTAGRTGLEARFVEGFAALAWRPGPWLVMARYGFTHELLPGARSAFGNRGLDVLSLMPALRLGERLSVAAGLHAGRSSLGDSVRWVWTGTVRPSVRVVGGLEVAGEVARRTSSPDSEGLESYRVEVAWRTDERLRVAAGYTLLGFHGLGLQADSSDDQGRLYLRAEVAY